LYTAARIAEACSMLTEDVYTPAGKVRPSVNIRKSATKGKLATRTIPVIEDLRSLLSVWQPHAGKIYLFPGRHPAHHWRHITSDSAARCLREACNRVGIEGASTHSFRRTALTQMSNAGIPLRVIQQVSGHRTLTELQKYLEVSDAQVRGAVSALSMLSYGGKPRYPASTTMKLGGDMNLSLPRVGSHCSFIRILQNLKSYSSVKKRF
jgi:integrase/recombinase XerD